MKNALLNAAMHITAPYGVRINAYKLSDRIGLSVQQLTEAVQPYVPVAVDMYEMGEEVAMGDAVKPFSGFISFGEWFGGFCRDNNRVPEEQEALEALANCIFNAFSPQMTSQQDDILRSRLDAEVKEYASE